MKSIFAFAVFSLTLTSFAQEQKPMIPKLNESKKASFFCKFKPSTKSDLVSAKIDIDLEKNKAVLDVDWSADNVVNNLSILTFSRAFKATDTVMLTKFVNVMDTKNKYGTPDTLVIGGSDGDMSDQTLVLQYIARATNKQELADNRIKGLSDFQDINLTYIISTHGRSRPFQTTCSMDLK